MRENPWFVSVLPASADFEPNASVRRRAAA
jgi:hypothetical protein